MMNHLKKGKETFLIHSLYVRKPILDRSYVVTGRVSIRTDHQVPAVSPSCQTHRAFCTVHVLSLHQRPT